MGITSSCDSDLFLRASDSEMLRMSAFEDERLSLTMVSSVARCVPNDMTRCGQREEERGGGGQSMRLLERFLLVSQGQFFHAYLLRRQ